MDRAVAASGDVPALVSLDDRAVCRERSGHGCWCVGEEPAILDVEGGIETGAYTTQMVAMLVAFAVSLVLTLVTVRLTKRRIRAAGDHDTTGPQKFHAGPVPRIGGLGIFIALVVGCIVVALRDREIGESALVLLACGLPAFGAGIAEDLTKDLSPRRRLFFTAMSAGLAAMFAAGLITRTDIPGLDWVVSYPAGAVLVTVFVVAGVANAVNIIDGFNGLASMCVVMMLVALAYVAFEVGDRLIMLLALAGVGAVLGFFFWNFPAGLIFLGDGGAYFLGFYVAELAILLLHRNPSVSPLFPLLLCFYPVFETLFSIYRKRYLRGISPGVPDGVHLHMLVYKRLMRFAVGTRNARDMKRRNSMTSPYLWMLCMLSVIPAMLWWDSTPVLAVFVALFALLYVAIYWRIVRFRTPRWLVVTRPQEDSLAPGQASRRHG
jgi:UDP-N-acetylmuramyl pentapeptide phosphotransferase/UDP-N-acetylglucosamine-1-phosphate transferase